MMMMDQIAKITALIVYRGTAAPCTRSSNRNAANTPSIVRSPMVLANQSPTLQIQPPTSSSFFTMTRMIQRYREAAAPSTPAHDGNKEVRLPQMSSPLSLLSMIIARRRLDLGIAFFNAGGRIGYY